MLKKHYAFLISATLILMTLAFGITQRYELMESGRDVLRIDRMSGETYLWQGDKFRKIVTEDRADAEDLPQESIDLVEIDAVMDEDGIITAEIYNGSEYNLKHMHIRVGVSDRNGDLKHDRIYKKIFTSSNFQYEIPPYTRREQTIYTELQRENRWSFQVISMHGIPGD